MLVRILGAIDIILGFILIFINNLNLSHYLLIFFGIVLLIKSFIGIKSLGGWIDLLAGIIFLLFIVFSIPWIITILFGVLLIQKGIMSFL